MIPPKIGGWVYIDLRVCYYVGVFVICIILITLHNNVGMS